MSNTPPENSVEQRRRVLKGALAASGVATMGYSGSALASFQCVTSTEQTAGLYGFKKTLSSGSNWAWLRLQVFSTNKANDNQGSWRAVKVPMYSDPYDSATKIFFFQDTTTAGNSPPLLPEGATGLPNGIAISGAGIANQYAYVLIYFKTDGAIAGFFPTYAQPSSTGYPAQGSCLTSLNPNMVQTNIFYGG